MPNEQFFSHSPTLIKLGLKNMQQNNYLILSKGHENYERP